jgi:hypothetical protein
VLSGFTPINNSRKQNPVPPPIRTELRTPSITASDTEGLFPPEWGTIQSDSEPNDQDPEAGPATVLGRGPLAAVSTASSACTSASPEAPVRTTVLPICSDPAAPASAPQRNVAPKTTVHRPRSSAVRSTLPQVPASASQRAQAPETPTFNYRHPRRLPVPPVAGPSRPLVAESPSPLAVRQRRNIPETPPGVQEAYASAPEASSSVREIFPILEETSPRQRLPFKITQASKAKITLGLLNLPKVYTLIRNSLKAEMQNVGWVNKSTSVMAAFNALCLYLMNLPSLNSFLPIWTGGDSDAHRALASALHWFIRDVGTKDKLSGEQGDRQFKEVAGDSDDDDDGGAQAAGRRSRKGKEHAVPPELVRPSIMVTVVDPDALGAFYIIIAPPTYDWNDPLNEPSFSGILTKITFSELCNLILKYTAPGRAVRTIWRALDNVPPAAVPPVRPVEVQITDLEELEG